MSDSESSSSTTHSGTDQPTIRSKRKRTNTARSLSPRKTRSSSRTGQANDESSKASKKRKHLEESSESSPSTTSHETPDEPQRPSEGLRGTPFSPPVAAGAAALLQLHGNKTQQVLDDPAQHIALMQSSMTGLSGTSFPMMNSVFMHPMFDPVFFAAYMREREEKMRQLMGSSPSLPTPATQTTPATPPTSTPEKKIERRGRRRTVSPPKKSDVFYACTFCISSQVKRREDIEKAIRENGGNTTSCVTRNVTSHFVAPKVFSRSLGVRDFESARRNGIAIVNEDFVIDSVRLKQIQDPADYPVQSQKNRSDEAAPSESPDTGTETEQTPTHPCSPSFQEPSQASVGTKRKTPPFNDTAAEEPKRKRKRTETPDSLVETSPFIVKLNIGGQIFQTLSDTLESEPGSLLAELLGEDVARTSVVDGEGNLFIDRDPTHFRFILNYLRDRENFSLPRDVNVLHQLRVEASYYSLFSLVDEVNKAMALLTEPPSPHLMSLGMPLPFSIPQGMPSSLAYAVPGPVNMALETDMSHKDN